MSNKRRKVSHVGNRPPEDEPWVWIPRSVIDSPGFMALSINGLRIFIFLLSEHMSHGGQENGRLVCPYNGLQRRMRCSRHAISAALQELEQFGLVKFTRGERLGGRPGATTARITFYAVDGKAVTITNDYKRVTTSHVARFKQDQRKARLVLKERRRKAKDPA